METLSDWLQGRRHAINVKFAPAVARTGRRESSSL